MCGEGLPSVYVCKYSKHVIHFGTSARTAEPLGVTRQAALHRNLHRPVSPLRLCLPALGMVSMMGG